MKRLSLFVLVFLALAPVPADSQPPAALMPPGSRLFAGPDEPRAWELNDGVLADAPPIYASAASPGLRGRWDLLAGPLDPPPMYAEAVIRDPMRHRLLLLDARRPEELWVLALPATGQPDWSRIAVAGPVYPPARTSATVVHDPAGDRLVLFGGWGPWYGDGHSDTWALELGNSPQWRRIETAGTVPTGGAHQAGAFDVARRRLWVFGAIGSGAFDELWYLDLGGTPAWTRIATPGHRPCMREGARMVVDPWSDRLVMFGGWYQLDARLEYRILNDTWVLPLHGTAAWDSLALAVRPPGRQMYAAALDTDRHRFLVSGGSAWQTGHDLADTWALHLDGEPVWEQIATHGTSAGPVSWHAGAYAPERGSLIHYGAQWSVAQNEAFELELATGTWSRIEPVAPVPFPGRHGAFLFADPDLDRTLMWFGQLWAMNDPPVVYSHLHTSGNAPVSGYVVDTKRRRLIGLGGGVYSARGGLLNQVWQLPLDEPRVWSQVPVAGTSPVGRFSYGAVYDPLRDRVLVYGGLNYSSVASRFIYALSDLWELSLDPPRWTQLHPANPPAGRGGQGTLYDPLRDRLLILGGERGGYDATFPIHDVWSLDLAHDSLTWARLPADVPADGGTVHDPNRDRVLLWSGSADAWSLQLANPSAWVPVSTAGFWPEPRSGSGVRFDAERDRMLVYGGQVVGGFPSPSNAGDLYALRFSQPVTIDVRPGSSDDVVRLGSHGLLDVAVLADPAFSPDSLLVGTVTFASAHADVTPGRGHANRRDVNGDGRLDLVLKFPLDSLRLAPSDTFALLLGETPAFEVRGRGRVYVARKLASRTSAVEQAAVTPAGPPILALSLPSPGIGGLRVEYSLPSAAPAQLEVFDVAGRRMAERRLEGVSAGAHVLEMGAGLRPGLYLVRLMQHGSFITARAVLVR